MGETGTTHFSQNEKHEKQKYLSCLGDTQQEAGKTRKKSEHDLALAQNSREDVGNTADDSFHHGELWKVQK